MVFLSFVDYKNKTIQILVKGLGLILLVTGMLLSLAFYVALKY